MKKLEDTVVHPYRVSFTSDKKVRGLDVANRKHIDAFNFGQGKSGDVGGSITK
jgi:hypothetical protein